MSKRHYYLLSRLPELATFGSPPPVAKEEFLELVREAGGPRDPVEVLLLGEDLIEREAVLSGEIEMDAADPVVLSTGQTKGEEPLPDYLTGEGEAHIAVDSLWQRYFQHALGVAGAARTPLLGAWVGFEVGLRNALVQYRAERLKMDPRPYTVAQELGDRGIPFKDILVDWARAPDPLAAQEFLERTRWGWVTEHESWYSFNSDEVIAYAAKLIILHRWHRIAAQTWR